MFLKSIQTRGFKSFADPVDLTFSDGVTAIVGPNGSGKSNISDAVRWVLGEQSAKSLRGGSMQDVIFSGTQKRSPLGFAEVTLVLDNSDHVYDVDFVELSVTRRVYRSGESEYRINNAPCRLKDIHELFMDTGLGRDGYSMIGQGRVEEILSSKSEDRREIFEEASGISKYRHRKEEAQRKLDATEDNLSRIADIIGELDAQLEPLERQSEKAKQYLKLKEELRLYEVNAALTTIETNRAELARIKGLFDIVSAQLNGAKAEMEQAEAKQEQMYTLSSEQEQSARDTEAQLHSKEAENTRLAGEIEVLRNTIAGNETLAGRVHSELADLAERVGAVEQELAAAEQQKQGYEAQKAEKEAEIAELTAQSEQSVSSAEEHNAELEANKQAVMDKLDEISSHKIKLSNFDALRASFTARSAALAAELAEKRAGQDSYAKKQAEQEQSLLRKRAFVQELSAQLARGREEKEGIANGLSERQKALTACHIELNEKKSQLSILRAMEQGYEGYARSVKAVMKAGQAGQLTGLHGPVSRLVTADKAHLTALETALGGTMQNIVVDSEEDAKRAIAYLKQTNGGRATFLPLTAVQGKEMDVSRIAQDAGYVGLASELARYDGRYAGVVRQLLGRTVVVDTVDNGIAMSRRHKNTFRIVTLTGEQFSIGGAMAGGSSDRRASLLGRETEIARLAKQVEELERRFGSMERELAAEQEREKTLTDQLEADAAILRENEEIIIRLEQNIAYHKAMSEGAGSQVQSLETEAESLQERMAQGERDAEATRGHIARLEAEADALRAKVSALEEGFERAMVQRQRIQDQIVDRTVELGSIQKDIEVAADRIESLLRDKTAHRDNQLLRESELTDIGQKNAQLTEDIAHKQEQITGNQATIAQLTEQVQELLKNKQTSEEQTRELAARAKELRETVYALQQEHTRIEGRKVKFETEEENAINRLWDDYELTYTAAERYRAEVGSPAEVTKRIAQLRGDIRGLGNVNVDAIEEFKTVSERHAFLTAQQDDLVRAKENLLKLISEMVDIMHDRFLEQFSVIARHFKETFSELFGGGRAEVRLSDPANVLESGIEIDVQPPGKKLQSLSLLSGGERALSAIALLCAILKTRPTPFCFLDEIEAALDDVNVYRFADYIRRYSKDTQFIVVTHRRGTMEAADVIYGVTMQEKGVSKILRLDLSEAMAEGK